MGEFFYDINNPDENNEREKLSKVLINDFFNKKTDKIKSDIDRPYQGLIEFLVQDNLIHKIFESIKNRYYFKFLHEDRDKGIITLIPKEEFENIYKSFKKKDVDFNKLNSASFNFYTYNSQFISSKIHTVNVLDVLNEKIDTLLNQSKSNFSKSIALYANKVKLIENTIDELFVGYTTIKKTSKNVNKIDVRYYLLIQEKLNQILKDLIVSYYDLLPVKTIKKIKSEFPNLHLLFSKNDIKSFISTISIENKLNKLRIELIKFIELVI